MDIDAVVPLCLYKATLVHATTLRSVVLRSIYIFSSPCTSFVLEVLFVLVVRPAARSVFLCVSEVASLDETSAWLCLQGPFVCCSFEPYQISRTVFDSEFCFPVAQQPSWGIRRLIVEFSRSHTHTHTHTHVQDPHERGINGSQRSQTPRHNTIKTTTLISIRSVRFETAVPKMAVLGWHLRQHSQRDCWYDGYYRRHWDYY
jgi:hypothetical protein